MSAADRCAGASSFPVILLNRLFGTAAWASAQLEHVRAAVTGATRRCSTARWRAWCDLSMQGGAGAAHVFSKAVAPLAERSLGTLGELRHCMRSGVRRQQTTLNIVLVVENRYKKWH